MQIQYIAASLLLMNTAYSAGPEFCLPLFVQGQQISRAIPEGVEGVWKFNNISGDTWRWIFYTDAETKKNYICSSMDNKPAIQKEVQFLECTDKMGHKHIVMCVDYGEVFCVRGTPQAWYMLECNGDEIRLSEMIFLFRTASELQKKYNDIVSIRNGGHEKTHFLDVIVIDLSFNDFESFMSNNYDMMLGAKSAHEQVLSRLP